MSSVTDRHGNPRGYLALVLHAHLPFVRHPEHDVFLEEDWLYEAITETYIPLLWMMEGLVRDEIDFRLTMSLTPPLVSMLNDELLRSRYERHLDSLCELAEKEVERTRHMPAFHGTAQMYRARFNVARIHYQDHWKRDLLGAFRRLQELGKLEVITCAATHGFLPLMRSNPAAVRAQVFVAAQYHHEIFGRPPLGIWLPECGFYPGLDEVVREAGIRYFFVDSHAIHRASGRVKWGVHAPLYCPSGIAAFGRDDESAKQVWSSIDGYPGDSDYRDFYRDIGFDLDLDHLRPHVHPDGIRVNTGIKYFRVTGKTESKEAYVRAWALDKAARHANDFLLNRQRQVEWLRGWMGRAPIVVAPYDSELFGHWWFEGPEWIDALFRKIARDQDTVHLTTPSEYLERYPVNQVEMPAGSSWGNKGFNEVWLNGSNDWLYRHLHVAADRMVALAEQFVSPTPLEERALNQAARELLLAQASDWAFILTRATAVPYAVKRTKEHLLRFNHLHAMLQQGVPDEAAVVVMESSDCIFPRLNYRVYRPGWSYTSASHPSTRQLTQATGNRNGTNT
jgi:1,4-alpha-glucan branching enzyme